MSSKRRKLVDVDTGVSMTIPKHASEQDRQIMFDHEITEIRNICCCCGGDLYVKSNFVVCARCNIQIEITSTESNILEKYRRIIASKTCCQEMTNSFTYNEQWGIISVCSICEECQILSFDENIIAT